jgi:hypothetical protein
MKLATSVEIVEHDNDSRTIFVDGKEFPWYTAKGKTSLTTDDNGVQYLSITIPVLK